ncbi:hypothetical protein HDV06_003143, partial [Boothiomyces sp. JEL0866]
LKDKVLFPHLFMNCVNSDDGSWTNETWPVKNVAFVDGNQYWDFVYHDYKITGSSGTRDQFNGGWWEQPQSWHQQLVDVWAMYYNNQIVYWQDIGIGLFTNINSNARSQPIGTQVGEIVMPYNDHTASDGFVITTGTDIPVIQLAGYNCAKLYYIDEHASKG